MTSPQNVAQENSIDLAGTTLLYYDVYEREFDGNAWQPYAPDPSLLWSGPDYAQRVKAKV